MDRRCDNCQTAVPGGTRFCPNCGADTSQGQGTTARRETSFPGAQQGTFGTQEVPPPGTPPGTPPQPVFAPEGVPAGGPGGGRSSRGLLYVGGCAAAAVLGLVALVVVGALLYFVLSSGSETGQGSPRDLFEQQVGDFRLQNVGDFPPGIQRGAVEAASSRYAGPNSAALEHNLMQMSSARDAEETWRRIRGDNEEQGFKVTNEQSVELDGRAVGTVAVVEGRLQGNNVTLVMWHNEDLYGEVISESGGDEAVEFYRNIPY